MEAGAEIYSDCSYPDQKNDSEKEVYVYSYNPFYCIEYFIAQRSDSPPPILALCVYTARISLFHLFGRHIIFYKLGERAKKCCNRGDAEGIRNSDSS